MSTGLTDLYQEVILDHSRHPRNFGPAEEANRTARGNNPLCGDRVTVHLKVNDDVIEDARFEARGCAISLASASMMTEMIKGKSETEARELFERFQALVTGETLEDESGLESLSALSGVKDFPTRIKCATLAWYAMSAALDGTQDNVKTE
jgi:nitrogen fixation protein NifU and related proteins